LFCQDLQKNGKGGRGGPQASGKETSPGGVNMGDQQDTKESGGQAKEGEEDVREHLSPGGGRCYRTNSLSTGS